LRHHPRRFASAGEPINTEAGFNKITSEQLASNVRTFPLRLGFVRSDKVDNYDFAVIKKTRIGESGAQIQFKAEILNAFDHPLLFTTQVNTTPTQAGFGSLTAGTQENYPRRLQLSVKLVF
jgi:hypothetical protein